MESVRIDEAIFELENVCYINGIYRLLILIKLERRTLQFQIIRNTLGKKNIILCCVALEHFYR